MSTRRAWVGLGSNLGDSAATVRAGVRALAALPATTIGPSSSLYRSAPVGVLDQPDFCNAVAGVDTALSPLALLAGLQQIEQHYGRVRTRRWGPRTLDLDLLLYGDRRVEETTLTVPHPRLHERAFVLLPLAELAPTVQVPGLGRVDALAAALPAQGVRAWESKHGCT